jgi:hypothetical protein
MISERHDARPYLFYFFMFPGLAPRTPLLQLLFPLEPLIPCFTFYAPLHLLAALGALHFPF